MAEVLVGDRDSVRSMPPLSSLICTIAPLAQDEHGIEEVMASTEAGFMSVPTIGSMVPATVGGALTLGDVRKRARAKLDRILAEHEPEPLDEVAQAELLVILDAAEREMETQRYGLKESAGS
jgi:trimethylamine:corrinoid methyltransferase-like protein